MEEKLSILYPENLDPSSYRSMSEEAWHDLGMDQICQQLSAQADDRRIVRQVMSYLSPDPRVASYRADVFEDIMKNVSLQEQIVEILNQVGELQEYMSLKRNLNEMDNLWTLMRRLKEVQDYISCVERLQACLSQVELKSQGLIRLRDYVEQISGDCFFRELKEDISCLRLETRKVKSITLGLNLGEYYDIINVGVVSINDKPYTKSGILSNFSRKIMGGDQIQQGTESKNHYSYEPIVNQTRAGLDPSGTATRSLVSAANPLMGLTMSMASVAPKTPESSIVEHLNQVTTKMLAGSVKRLKEVLSRYATVNIFSISGLIPEFRYYILWAGYMRQLQHQGYLLSKAEAVGPKQEQAETPESDRTDARRGRIESDRTVARAGRIESERPETDEQTVSPDCERTRMQAVDVYNLKLAAVSQVDPSEIVLNDLDFTDQHSLYLLTGANRGGKTTITQTIGQLYVLAQAGIFIPGRQFIYCPVDAIYTHFPADEDKTMNYGRLGEECSRFRDLYKESTADSLILLNESFSTTSFEEGYYIARDAIRAILDKGCRTIYNTHMHKLAQDVDQMNADSHSPSRAVSLIVKAEEGRRSYKVEIAPAQGQSMAMDIARKYGVTYEQLMEE